MPGRPRRNGGHSEITFTVVGSILTVTDGVNTRKAAFATNGAAKSLATRMKNDPVMAAKWLSAFSPVQLDLPLDTAND
ncbi:MAG: hypothetical protein WCJ64_09475 [Rhodospirillaceae bacterium]